MFELTGKTALVTGAGAGIGKATALLLARQGAAVALVARRGEMLAQVREQIEALGGRALAIVGDVTDPAFASEAVERTIKAFGGIDILVNNAGISDLNKSIKNCSDSMWESNLAVNETAPFRFCREAIRRMDRQREGRIVNVSSMGGAYALAGVSYSSAKMAVIGLTRNIAMQYAGRGIRCNCICPGPTLTDMIQAKPGAPAPDIDREMESMTCRHLDPEAGPSQPEDMAAAILFLVSDEACGINGQSIVVDRGLCL